MAVDLRRPHRSYSIRQLCQTVPTNHLSLITVLRSPLSTFPAMTALSAFLQLARLKTTKTQPMKISAAPVSPIKSRWIWRKKIAVKRMMKSG